MATLAGLRTLVYAYLGTTATDPAYPAATINALVNAAGNGLLADVHQARPDLLQKYTTLTAASTTSRDYTLPSDYAGWLEVRSPDGEGTQLGEVRREELFNASGFPAFAITGPDGGALLQTSPGLNAGVTVFLLYRYQPAELAGDTESPTWLASSYHDLIARQAAIDAFGLGNESAPSPLFVRSTEERRAQFWASISRRGVAPTIQRF